jgi:Protein of unknown function (DUF2934)
MTAIPIQTGTTILDEIESVYDDITKRAYEKFLDRGGTCTVDIEDWLAAERELLLKPDVRLLEKHGYFIVRVGPFEADPPDVSILATRDDLVVQSLAKYPHPRIFRIVHFPQPIDLGRIRSSCVRGKLLVIAFKASVNGACGAGPERAASGALHTAHR